MFKIKYKAIAYAYPTSTTAENLGFGDTGCYFVQHTAHREDNSWKSFVAHNCEGFDSPTDPDLLSLYHEYEGSMEPSFAKLGKPEILAAIQQARVFPSHFDCRTYEI